MLEAMGRHSNLILLDGGGPDHGLPAAGGQRHVRPAAGAARPVLPPPPAQEKLAPSSLDRAALESALAAAPEESQADKWLLDTFGGLSPSSAVSWLSGRGEPPTRGCIRWGKGAGLGCWMSWKGSCVLCRKIALHLSCWKRRGIPPTLPFSPSASTAPPSPASLPLLLRPSGPLYEQRENQERVHQRGQDLIRSVTNARDRAARKIGLQEQELAATRDRERLRQFGDIITSNLHAMEKGDVPADGSRLL